MKKSLQVFLGLFGIAAIFIASLHIVLGPSAIPGSIPVNATMDSEDRLYATLFAAYGVALLWCIKDIERKSTVVYFLALTFFIGGLARLVSMAAVGPPDTFFNVVGARCYGHVSGYGLGSRQIGLCGLFVVELGEPAASSTRTNVTTSFAARDTSETPFATGEIRRTAATSRPTTVRRRLGPRWVGTRRPEPRRAQPVGRALEASVR